jgi:hypothetical protein
MKTPAFILTENSLTVSIDGATHTINSGHPGWKTAIECLKKKDYVGLKDCLSIKKAFTAYTDGKVVVKNNMIWFNGEPIHNYLTSKILNFIELGLPHESLIKFLERLMANPSRRAVNELYSFLSHKNLPITDSGTFLAYKSVREDYTDHHSGSFNNSIGNILEMPRNRVDDNYQNGCSYGFHAGSLEYASSFGGKESILLIVEIDPADVVSVPSDSDCQKLRTCKYKVIAKYDGPLPDHYASPNLNKDCDDDENTGSSFDMESDWDERLDDDDCDHNDSEEVSVIIKVGNSSQKFVRDSKGRFAKAE